MDFVRSMLYGGIGKKGVSGWNLFRIMGMESVNNIISSKLVYLLSAKFGCLASKFGEVVAL